MTQMTQKQIDAVKRMNSALKTEGETSEIFESINEFMYEMPDTGILDPKVSQELFHDTPVLKDVNATDEKGDMLLHHFLRNSDGKNPEHKEILDVILSYNPNPFTENKDGITPMECLTVTNAVEFAPIMAKYVSTYNKNMGRQLQELIAYATIEPDMSKELAEWKTSRQGFEDIANKMAGSKNSR